MNRSHRVKSFPGGANQTKRSHPKEPDPVLILLVHGLGRTPLSLFGLSAALRRAGSHTRFFGYSSTFEGVPRIVRRLAKRLRNLARCGEPVGLVGHSLGGLLLRKALPAAPALRVHHLVFLGTPARPPRMARLAWKWFPPFRSFTRDCGRFLMSPDAFVGCRNWTFRSRSSPEPPGRAAGGRRSGTSRTTDSSRCPKPASGARNRCCYPCFTRS